MEIKQSPPFLDVVGATQTLRISRSLLLKLVNEGRLPSPIKIGSRSVWVADELISAVKSQSPIKSDKRSGHE